MDRDSHEPVGQAWLEVIKRPSLQAFATAFVKDCVLDGSVVRVPILGVAGIRAFFDATRTMYDRIAFVHETRSPTRTFLEWEGEFAGREIGGTTILALDAAGLIERIRIYHRPYEQVLAFSAELALRLADKVAAAAGDEA